MVIPIAHKGLPSAESLDLPLCRIVMDSLQGRSVYGLQAQLPVTRPMSRVVSRINELMIHILNIFAHHLDESPFTARAPTPAALSLPTVTATMFLNASSSSSTVPPMPALAKLIELVT